MNRKWLAAFTFCVLVLGLTLLRAQSPTQSQPQAPATEPSAAGWAAADPLAEPFDVFTAPVDPSAGPGLPFPDPAAGDVFFYSTGPEVTTAFVGPPEFAMAVPFPGPDPQGGAVAGGVSFVGPDPQDNITFVGFEAGLGNQAVAGAPYSATVTSEFEQTLPDGNRVERKTSTTVYRDSQGRTRREQTLPAIGQYSASPNTPQAIFINDPAAGVNYVLDPAHKIARKMARPQLFLSGPGGPGRGGRGPGGNPPQNNAGPIGPRRGLGPDPNVTTESLGTKNIEGILVQGTRVTRTIPAGTVGNRNPIQVTSERWYSPDLKINLLVKNVDPLRGTNTTSLSDIRTDEPAAPLFQVPSDYTVQDAPKRMIMRGQRGGGPPPPPPQQ